MSLNVELINPFVSASYSVLSMVFSEVPTKGALTAQPQNTTNNQVNVVIGVTGDAQGTVILGMSLITADRIASAMLNQSVKSFDQLAASAVAELGNMIAGNALQILSTNDFDCNIAPPAVIRGTKVEISTLIVPAITISMGLSMGELYLTTGLSDCRAARRAA